MPWQDRLQTAQWRGKKFLTQSHEAKEGRRLAVTDIPGRDDPVVEDLGAKARGWHVVAYFLGADYDRARDAFLALLREPGPQWLEHPWLGRVWVRAQDWSISESNGEGGWCSIGVDFVPGGMGVPQPEADMVDVAAQSIESFIVTGAEFLPTSFTGTSTAAAAAKLSLLGRINAALSKIENLISLAKLPLTMIGSVLRAIDNIKQIIGDVMALPGQYLRALRSLASALGIRDSMSERGSLSDGQRVRLVGALVRSAVAAEAPVSPTDSPALARDIVAERAARACFCMGTAMQIALADYKTERARDAVLAVLMPGIGSLLPTASDAVFQAAVSARLGVQRALQAQRLEPVQERALVLALPSTVLAYRMQADEATLIEQNAVRHPLFVRGVVRV